MSSSKLFLFSNKAQLNSGVRLLLELYCVIVIKHVAFFNIYACEIISNNGIHIYLSECNCSFGLEQKYWRINGFGEKEARIGGFAYPYSTPLND